LLGLISTITIGQSLVQGMPLAWGPDIHFPDVLKYLVDEGTVRLGNYNIGFLAGIPMLAMIYIGSKAGFQI
jgi:hypothetical protein